MGQAAGCRKVRCDSLSVITPSHVNSNHLLEQSMTVLHHDHEANPATTPGLTARRLSFSHAETKVLADIDLDIDQGEFVSLLGPSGCGKTTLLRLLAGLESPATGDLSWKGVPISGPSLERGVVFQDYSLFPWMTLRQNLSTALAKSHPEMAKSWRLDLADQYLEMVGLAESAHQYPFELSGGMQQRGAIARTLALGSPVLLMDEPFGALDPVNRARLQDLVLQVWAGVTPRRTVLFVTHDIEEALYLSTRIVMLGAAPGRIIEQIEVPFSRPRSRTELFDDSQFQKLRCQIAARFRQDFIARYEADSVFSQAEGI